MLAGQPVAGIDFIKFAIVGSCVFGIHATDNSEEISKLDALVAEKKLSKISKEEYDSCLKKKPADPVGLMNSNQDPAPLPPIKGQGAVVVSDAEVEQEVQVPIGQISSTEAALVVAPVVEAPAPEAAPEAPQQNTRSKKR